METAVAYIRVSSLRQVEEGGSLESQTKLVNGHVETHRYKLLRLFTEQGESAKTDQRPALQEMLRFCRDRKSAVRVVIVPKIDRLARNVTDYTNLKLQLSRLGIRLESIGERIEDTPVGRFTETILASVAQFDNEIRAERSKGGMIDAVSQGRWVWKAPVGYRNIRAGGKGTIEPDPLTASLIQEAFQMLSSGQQSVRAVRDHLRTRGVHMGQAGFYQLIHNEVYIGRIHAFGKVYEAQPPFVPLIDELTFLRAKAALKKKRNRREYKTDSEDFPLRGSATCPCSKRLTASWSKGERGQRYAYYRCMHCNRQSYAQKLVHGFFDLELDTYKGNPDAWDRLKVSLLEIEEQTLTAAREQRQIALDRIKKLESLRDAVVMKNAAGVIPDVLATRQIKRLGDEMEQIVGSLPSDSQASIEELVKFAERFFNDLRTNWQEFSLKTKKDLLQLMFPEGVLFFPERGFRTPENSLSERLRRVVSSTDSRLVDPGSDFPNELRDWLRCLKVISEEESQSTNRERLN